MKGCCLIGLISPTKAKDDYERIGFLSIATEIPAFERKETY